MHERANIGAASADPTPSESRDGVIISDYASVEVGAVIESGGTLIGEGCQVGVGSRVGRGAKLGKVSRRRDNALVPTSDGLVTRSGWGLTRALQHCILTPKTVIPPGEVVPDFTVVYSNGTRRLDRRGVTDLKNKAQARQIEVLRKLILSNPAKFQP